MKGALLVFIVALTSVWGAARPGMCTNLYKLWEGYPSDFVQSKPVSCFRPVTAV